MSPSLPGLANLNDSELRLVDFLLSRSGFIGSYVQGDYFQRQLQSVLGQTFLSAPRQHKDGFLAAAGALAGTKLPPLVSTNASTNLQRGSRALAAFRQCRVTSISDLTIALGLALALLTFSHFVEGANAHPICRYALQLVQTFENGRFIKAIFESDPNIICIMFSDYFHCLLHRQLPVLRYPEDFVSGIDRYYGVSATILSIWYDLCEIGWRMKERLALHTETEADLQRLMIAAQMWKPRFSLSTSDSSFDIPMQPLLCQARILQLTTILLAYKYHAAPQTFDREAADLSSQIRVEIRRLHEITSRGPLYVDFPYTVAMFEVTNCEDQADSLLELNLYSNGVRPVACQNMFNFLNYFWAMRAIDTRASWLTLVDESLQI